MCHAFVGGSTTPVPCETLDDSVCDVTVQYKVNISNQVSSSPTTEPSAGPSVEPSISAAPSSVSGKGGKGKEDSTGKGGKGKDKGKGKSSGTCSSTGALVIDQLSLAEVFARIPGGEDCPIDQVSFELPENDIIIPPGGEVTFEGSTFDINICQCHGWAYFVGVSATEEASSGDEPSVQPSISDSPSSEGKGGKGKESSSGKGKTGGKGKGKGKGKSGDEDCESCLLIRKDVQVVAKSPSSSPSAEPSISISPSMEPSVSLAPSVSSVPSPSPSVSTNAPTAKSAKKGGGKKGKTDSEEPTVSLAPSVSSLPSPSPTAKSGKKGGGKKGKSDAPSAAPSEEEIFPVCFICGEGEEVTIPDGIVQFPNPFPPPDVIAVTCQQLDDAGESI